MGHVSTLSYTKVRCHCHDLYIAHDTSKYQFLKDKYQETDNCDLAQFDLCQFSLTFMGWHLTMPE